VSNCFQKVPLFLEKISVLQQCKQKTLQHKTVKNIIKNSSLPQSLALRAFYQKNQLEMWANAKRDGRPAEYRWRPLFNAAEFG